MRSTSTLVVAVAIMFCMRNTHALNLTNSEKAMGLSTTAAGFLGLNGLPRSNLFSPDKQLAFGKVLTGLLRLKDIMYDMRQQVGDPSYSRSRHLSGLSDILYEVTADACAWMKSAIVGYHCTAEDEEVVKAKLYLFDSLERVVPGIKKNLC